MLARGLSSPGPQERLWVDAKGNVTANEAEGVMLAAAGGGVPVGPECAQKVQAYLDAQKVEEPEPEPEPVQMSREEKRAADEVGKVEPKPRPRK